MFSRALKWLKTFRRKDEGVTAIEYGLIAGLIAVAVVGALVSNGGALNDSFASIQGALDVGNSYGDGDGNGGGGDPVNPGGSAGDPGGLPGGGPSGNTDTDGLDPNDPAGGAGDPGAEDSGG